MNRKVRRAWIEALREQGSSKCTGSYALGLSNSDTAWGALGGTGQLAQEVRNPLGVLCELAAAEGVVERADDITVDASDVLEQIAPGCTGCRVAAYGEERAFRRLPAEVMAWAGISNSGVSLGWGRFVCDMAADGASFNDVADVLSRPWVRIQ